MCYNRSERFYWAELSCPVFCGGNFLKKWSGSKMKMIIGLGKSRQKIRKTKHNVGFMVVDALAEKYQATFKSSAFEAEIAEFFHER